MARHISPSQFRSKIRQAEQKMRQAINKHNSAVRDYNRKVKKAVNDHNRNARAHNARARANRQRLNRELTRLQRQATPNQQYVTFHVSVNAVQSAYEHLERSAESGLLDERYNELLDLSEREAANNAGLMNALLGQAEPTNDAEPNDAPSPLTAILASISEDLARRWQGALHALSPHNPDAARHFCTSARELITRIFDLKAPDTAVRAAMPGCECTPDRKTPTRRAKLRYFLHLKEMDSEDLIAFAESDMSNIVELFSVFNKGTHGEAGTFDFAELQAIRQRVEDGIMFLSRLID